MRSFIKGPQESKEGDSLSDLLPSQNSKVDFALLVLLCTDAMRKFQTDIFELPEEPPEKQQQASLIDFEDEDPSPGQESSRRKAALREERSRELASDETQQLRRASLVYFDAWRSKVLRRVCEVLAIKPDTIRLARKSYSADQAFRGKNEMDLLSDWTTDQRDDQSSRKNSRYIPIQTTLSNLAADQKSKLVQSALLLLLSLEEYTGHSRILLLRLASSLQVNYSDITKYEGDVAHLLLKAALASHTNDQNGSDATARKWKVGLAAVAGAAVIGVTGGLAAPLLAAGISTIFGGLGLGAVSGLLGALAGNTLIIGTLFGAYGAKMTGEMMDRYAKEVQDFKFLPLESDAPRDPSIEEEASKHRLRVAVGISGWIIDEADLVRPWHAFNSGAAEAFALQWEVEALLRLGVSLNTMLSTYIWREASTQIIKRTLLRSITAGLWPLNLLKIGVLVDNPFGVGRSRADKAGKVLAEALLAKVQGERPITLIGYSLGARLIYTCLLELAAQNAFGLVEDVILIGAPTPSASDAWTKIRGVASGRVVNVYSEDDLILGFLYRASSIQFNVAGLQPVMYVQGVENFDVGDLIDGHVDYSTNIGKLLERIGYADRRADAAEERPALPPRPAKRILDDAQIKGEIHTHLAQLERLRIDDTQLGSQSASPREYPNPTTERSTQGETLDKPTLIETVPQRNPLPSSTAREEAPSTSRSDEVAFRWKPVATESAPAERSRGMTSAEPVVPQDNMQPHKKESIEQLHLRHASDESDYDDDSDGGGMITMVDPTPVDDDDDFRYR